MVEGKQEVGWRDLSKSPARQSESVEEGSAPEEVYEATTVPLDEEEEGDGILPEEGLDLQVRKRSRGRGTMNPSRLICPRAKKLMPMH